MDIKRKIKQAANIIGIDELRKSQVKPINDILEGRDTMVVARPSAGKSAIYQILKQRVAGILLSKIEAAYARSGAQAA